MSFPRNCFGCFVAFVLKSFLLETEISNLEVPVQMTRLKTSSKTVLNVKEDKF